MKKIAVFILVLLAAACGIWYWNQSGTIVTENAVVEGRLSVAGPSVAGVISEVHVAAGQTVAKGQPLFSLDRAGYEAQLARERTRLAEIAASLPRNAVVPPPSGALPPLPGKSAAELRLEEEEARKIVEAAAHEHAAASVALSRLGNGAPGEYTKTNAKRQAALIARDEAAMALKKARDAHEKVSYARAKRESEEAMAATGGVMTAALAARIAEYQAQISRVNLAEQSLAGTVVTAPESGRIAILPVAVGMNLVAGETPVTIVPEDAQGIWVTAFFPAADAGKLAKGQECVIAPRGSGKTLPGKIGAIMSVPGTEKDVAARVILDQYGALTILAVGENVTVTVKTRGALDLPGKKRDGEAKN